MPFHPASAGPLFSVIAPGRLTQADLLRLAAGEVAAIHLRGAVPVTDCDRLGRVLDRIQLTDYDVRKYRIPAARLGPSLNEANAEGSVAAEYWEKKDQTLRFWSDTDDNVRSSSYRIVENAWSGEVGAATVAGRELFWGILRELNGGTVVHCDDVLREYPPTLLDSPPLVQMGFNMFASAPDAGGETLVWERKWQPADETHRTGVGYSPEILNGQAPIAVKPCTGDAIIFDSRNMHAVRPGSGRRRITLSFFIGLTAGERLIMWS